MLTNFEQVRDWILDNGFKRWALYKDRSRTDMIIDSQFFSVSDIEDKLAMTEKYLRMSGGYAYAAGGGSSANKADMNVVAEIRLEQSTPTPLNGVGMQPIDQIGELRESLKKELRAEIEAEKYKQEKAEFEKDKAAFKELESGVWGAIVKTLGPVVIGKLGGTKTDRLVAGLDEKEQVEAEPIKPIVAKEPEDPQEPQAPQAPAEDSQEQLFTEEEEQEAYDLLARFKAVEPEWLKLLRSVVEMAESGDKNYTLARSVLL